MGDLIGALVGKGAGQGIAQQPAQSLQALGKSKPQQVNLGNIMRARSGIMTGNIPQTASFQESVDWLSPILGIVLGKLGKGLTSGTGA